MNELPFHSSAAFELRMHERQTSPNPLTDVRAYYHIACMHNWREVVTEQFRLFSHAGIPFVTAVVLGAIEEAYWVVEAAQRARLNLIVAAAIPDLGRFETPTLNILYHFARNSPLHACLYVHTKGVSQPDDLYKAAWRRIMQKHVVADWKENLNRLAVADLVGVNWQDSPDFPHFAGNFWMARSDWIASLESPECYRQKFPDIWLAGNSWERMHAEMWLGSQPYHHVDCLCCRNSSFWSGDFIFGLDANIPGFCYT